MRALPHFGHGSLRVETPTVLRDTFTKSFVSTSLWHLPIWRQPDWPPARVSAVECRCRQRGAREHSFYWWHVRPLKEHLPQSSLPGGHAFSPLRAAVLQKPMWTRMRSTPRNLLSAQGRDRGAFNWNAFVLSQVWMRPVRDALSSSCVFILPLLRWLCASVCRGSGLGGVKIGSGRIWRRRIRGVKWDKVESVESAGRRGSAASADPCLWFIR